MNKEQVHKLKELSSDIASVISEIEELDSSNGKKLVARVGRGARSREFSVDVPSSVRTELQKEKNDKVSELKEFVGGL